MADWCRYCGEEFRSPVGKRYVVCEGQRFPIHTRHYLEYWERGRLPYRDGPRRGILADDWKDMVVIGGAVLAWLILIPIIARLAASGNLTMGLW